MAILLMMKMKDICVLMMMAMTIELQNVTDLMDITVNLNCMYLKEVLALGKNYTTNVIL